MMALSEFLKKTQAERKPVLVLAQIPALKINVQRLKHFNMLGFPVGSALDQNWILANLSVKQLVDRFYNARFIDLSTLDVFKQAPFNEGQPIYYDNNHLNELGSRLYGIEAVSEIDNWVKKVFVSQVNFP